MLGTYLKLEGLRGVGTVDLDLQENQRVYAFIGTNGIGKTKTLEALFQVLLFSNEDVWLRVIAKADTSIVSTQTWVFETSHSNDDQLMDTPSGRPFGSALRNKYLRHNLPVVFIAAQNRGIINSNQLLKSKTIGTFTERRADYFKHIIQSMDHDFSSLNMNVDIEEWFITLAQSSNPYQKREDNRDIEIRVVLKLLHEIDNRIDPEFLQISGDSKITLKLDGQIRRLSQLSSGFASILKIIQAIVSGYGYFTNETRLQQVRGIVLIDEIESHLHLSWQANIIPLLKRLFPNTTFYITTHSSIVLSQLSEGEAYRLERAEDGIVHSHIIKAPDKMSIIDVMKDAYGIDLNQLKRDRMSPEKQQATKQKLLDLLNAAGGDE